jgi:hypothetical protein
MRHMTAWHSALRLKWNSHVRIFRVRQNMKGSESMVNTLINRVCLQAACKKIKPGVQPDCYRAESQRLMTYYYSWRTKDNASEQCGIFSSFQSTTSMNTAALTGRLFAVRAGSSAMRNYCIISRPPWMMIRGNVYSLLRYCYVAHARFFFCGTIPCIIS